MGSVPREGGQILEHGCGRDPEGQESGLEASGLPQERGL